MFVDSRTEAGRLGAFPYDRAVYAQAILAAKKEGARAVVLKYFLDQPKTAAGDAALARAMQELPAFVQFAVSLEEPRPNALPERFFIGPKGSTLAYAVEGDEGWLPLPLFAKASAGAGFVDIADEGALEQVPLVGRYKGRPVKSLWLVVVEWANQRPVISPKKEATVIWPAASEVGPLSMIDLLDGKIPAGALKGKIVVLGYSGPKAGTFKMKSGTVSAHEAFYLALLGLYRLFA